MKELIKKINRHCEARSNLINNYLKLYNLSFTWDCFG